MEKYQDEIIPEDKEFAKRIVRFIIDVLTYAIDNFGSIDKEGFQEFLAYYDHEFLYGPSGDDHNYLEFDENLDGMPVTELPRELRDREAVTRGELVHLRSQYEQVLVIF